MFFFGKVNELGFWRRRRSPSNFLYHFCSHRCHLELQECKGAHTPFFSIVKITLFFIVIGWIVFKFPWYLTSLRCGTQRMLWSFWLNATSNELHPLAFRFAIHSFIHSCLLFTWSSFVRVFVIIVMVKVLVMIVIIFIVFVSMATIATMSFMSSLASCLCLQ